MLHMATKYLKRILLPKNMFKSIFLISTIITISTSSFSRASNLYAMIGTEKLNIIWQYEGSKQSIQGYFKGKGDIIIVITGPNHNYTINKKERRYLMWIKTASYNLFNLPSFYKIATSGSQIISKIVHNNLFTSSSYLFNIHNMKMISLNENNVETNVYKTMFINKMMESSMYSNNIEKIKIYSGNIFKWDFYLPNSSSVGVYKANIYLINNKNIVEQTFIPFIIEKSKLEQSIYYYSFEHKWIYAILSIITASLAGIIANYTLKRLFNKK